MQAGRLAVRAACAVVGVGALIMLAPFYLMLVFATRSRTEVFALRPPPGTPGLVSFIAGWSNFTGPLIVLCSPVNCPLPFALRSLQGRVDTEWGVLMGGLTIATIPLPVAFAPSSRWLICGLAARAK